MRGRLGHTASVVQELNCQCRAQRQTGFKQNYSLWTRIYGHELELLKHSSQSLIFFLLSPIRVSSVINNWISSVCSWRVQSLSIIIDIFPSFFNEVITNVLFITRCIDNVKQGIIQGTNNNVITPHNNKNNTLLTHGPPGSHENKSHSISFQVCAGTWANFLISFTSSFTAFLSVVV